MKLSFSPLKTALVGGVVFLFPLIVVLYVVGQGLTLVAGLAGELAGTLPVQQVGAVAVATVAGLALTASLRGLGKGTAALLENAGKCHEA